MWPNPQETADLVTFTEEILMENFYFLCSSINPIQLLPVDIDTFSDNLNWFLFPLCLNGKTMQSKNI